MQIRELLTEGIKARIDHPEDLAWQEGSKGIKNAMQALAYVLTKPESTSIKWDGSPALIFGRNPTGEIIITDKSGFGAKGYDGKARSQAQLGAMIKARDPNNTERAKYADRIAGIWPIIAKAIPQGEGYYQGDLLYVGTPAVVDGNFVFKPNKVEYKIPVSSELGKKIAASKVGMVVHGFLANDRESVPTPVTDVSALQGNPEFLVLGAEMPGVKGQKTEKPAIPNTAGIDELLNPNELRARQLTNLGALIGKYMAGMASSGSSDYSTAAKGFIGWLDSSGESAKKIANAKEWIGSHLQGYNNLWAAIAAISNYKARVKAQLDRQVSGDISASLDGAEGHEGYVAATPYGKIKLVDRHVFMRKQ